MIIVLVGNKTDLGERREVTTQMGEEEAKRCGALFVETSAKVGANVKALFRKIAQALPGMEGAEAGRGESQSEWQELLVDGFDERDAETDVSLHSDRRQHQPHKTRKQRRLCLLRSLLRATLSYPVQSGLRPRVLGAYWCNIYRYLKSRA